MSTSCTSQLSKHRTANDAFAAVCRGRIKSMDSGRCFPVRFHILKFKTARKGIYSTLQDRELDGPVARAKKPVRVGNRSVITIPWLNAAFYSAEDALWYTGTCHK